MKIHAIINGSSRRASRSDVRKHLARRLDDHRLTVTTTDYSGHATALARDAAADLADIVIAVGGDGTVNEVLNGIVGTDIKLAVIPAGSANDLAAHFKLPADPDRACEVIFAGHLTVIDTVRVNDWHFVTTGGLGLPSEVIDRTNRLRGYRPIGRRFSRPGRSWVYFWGLAAALGRRIRYGRVTVEVGAFRLEAEPLSLTLSNLPRLGRHFCPAPEARPDNSRIDLCLIENRGHLHALLIALKVARGRHRIRPEVSFIRTAQVTITCDQPLRFFADGELRPAATEFEITVQPRSLRLLTPPPTEVT